MSSAEFSVMIATRNRCRALRETLDGLHRQEQPSVTWKLIVVDNGSTDATQFVLSEFRDRLPLEIILHATSGKNSSLNAGLAAVEGALIVLTDDDSIPEPGFLLAWEALLSSALDFTIFGGRIEPCFQGTPPKWIERASSHHLAMMFSKRDLPEGPVDPSDIYGCNMAIRASVFDAGHRFFEGIGPDGDDPDYAMGSEVEFCRRVSRAGAKAWFTRAPMVHHRVEPAQWSDDAWKRRGYRLGRGRARLAALEGQQVLAPQIGWAERLASSLPISALRVPALAKISLARGMRDELDEGLAARLTADTL